MSIIITTPDAAALMRDLTNFWGGREGIRYDRIIAQSALGKAQENAWIVRHSLGTPGYSLGRRIAVTRLKRCRAAMRRINREMESFNL